MANIPTSDDLRELARRYKEAGKKLLDRAESLVDIADSMDKDEPLAGYNGSARHSGEPIVARGSRFQQLKDFVTQYGPMKRSEIIERSGIPSGTIGMLLKPPDYEKNERGEWYVPDREGQT